MEPIAANPQPLLISLSRCSDARAGGKALRLAKLMEYGLRVPDGFVVLGATRGALPTELASAYESLGGAVAVRSSALSEDGSDASFAGQYDTFLNIEGAQAVRDAVERCLDSAHARRAQAYKSAMRTESGEAPDASPAGDPMSVVVQRMVKARAAGVLFTVDPVSGARDQLVVEATRGLGEALVSGHVSAERYLVHRDGRVLSQQLAHGSGEACLDAATLAELVRDSLHAESKFGHPLDLEWAVDEAGALHFLQARPITTMDLPGIDELDTPLDASEPQLFTTYNVSEVMPGAVSPLGWSVVGPNLERAMREMFVSFGVPRARLDNRHMLGFFSGRPFLNMRPMYEMARCVAGASKENADYSLAGHVLPDIPLDAPEPKLRRVINGVNYFRSLFKARQSFESFERRTASFHVPLADDPHALYQRIGSSLDEIRDGWTVHLQTSSLSGALYGVLLGILSSGKPAAAEHHATASTLLAAISPREPGAQSTSLALPQAFDRLVATIADDAVAAAHFRELTSEAALAWLRDGAPAAIRQSFASFLRDHGHRCVREAELHQADWQEDPRPLVASLQRAVAAPKKSGPPRCGEAEAALRDMPLLKRRLLSYLAKECREAVVLRERSKSHVIRVLRKLRGAYLALAERLVAHGRLPDTDLIFFLTHEELAELARGKQPRLLRRALHRRRLHPQKMALEFPPVSEGKPRPLEKLETAGGAADQVVMRGTPVSRGVITGRARVARTLEEADAIEPGEILVVPFTDVGWAPYFVRAAGLATEIGGTLSHGAVVAREYGLPAIVNLPGATRSIRTGDLLRLDGTTGELRRLAAAG